MSDFCNHNSNSIQTNTSSNGPVTNGSTTLSDTLNAKNVHHEQNNTFGATVIASRAVNYLLTKLRSKDTSGRVSVY